MKVLASVAPQAVWQAHQAQFKLATVEDPANLAGIAAQLLLPVQRPAQLAALLSQYPEAELIVGYQAPELLLGSILAAGESTEPAAAKWQADTESLLKLQQQHRRRVKLFCLTAIENSSNLNAMPGWINLKPDNDLSAEPDTVYTLLAAQVLRQQPELAALHQRLFASSLPLQEQAEHQLNLASITAEITDNTESEQIKADHATLQQQLSASDHERDLLLQQLLHVQEELEQLFQKKQTVKQQYSQLEQDYRNDVASLSAKLQHSEQAVEKITSQFHRLQDELNRITSAHNQSQQQLKQLTETEQNLKQQLQTADSQCKADNDERELLLQQLMHVQEELEQYYLKWQQAEHKANHAATAHNKQQQRELVKLESQLRKTKARAAGAEHQLQLLQQQLTAVKSSTLWKTGAPVRMLTRLVTKTDKAKQKLQQEAALIITSEYFDIDWYLSRNPDVAEGNINPAEHYLRFGASEGRMPGPLFDGDWYKQRYPDVAASGINPLLHFIKFGQQEGRTASPKLLTDNSMRGE